MSVTRIVTFVVIAIVMIMLLIGCATSRTRLASSLTWDQVMSRGSIQVSEPYYDRNSLILPISFTPKLTGDSLSVVCFSGHISGNKIVISADLHVPSSNVHPYQVVLPAEEVRDGEYQIIFKGGDGLERELGTKRVPTRPKD